MAEQDYNLEPVCPNCGEIYAESERLDLEDGEVATIECSSCRTKFETMRRIMIDYATWIEGKE